MKLILTSYLHPSLPELFSGKLAYIGDAARSYGDAPWTQDERNRLRDFGFELVELPVASTPREDIERILGEVDGVYVAGGETFDLLHCLRASGAYELLQDKVRAGLTYIGTSAGSVVTGPTIEHIAPMDNPDKAPDLHDYTGLGFIDCCIVPHASGTIPAYPVSIIEEIQAKFGATHPLQLLNDGQALLVEDDSITLI